MKNLLNLTVILLLGFYANAQDLSIGNQLFIDEDGDNTFQGFEGGTSNVTMNLWTVVNELPSAIIQSTTTDDQGMYLFENLFAQTYLIEIPTVNFENGGPLERFRSCDGIASALDGVDNDDNGADGVFGTNAVWSTFVNLSMLDGDEMMEQTVDFCFEVVCNDYDFQSTCDAAELVDPICSIEDFDNLCGIMLIDESIGNVPNPLCPSGGAPNNMTWFSFVAGTSEFEFDIVPNNCTDMGGFSGFQVGIYTDCTFTETVFCEPDCATDVVSVSSNNLLIGETYYVFLDGCANSVCDFEIIHVAGELLCDIEIEDCAFAQTIIAETNEDCFESEILKTVQGELVDNEGPTSLPCISDDNLVTWYQVDVVGDSTDFVMAHVDADGFDPVWAFYTGISCDAFTIVEAIDTSNALIYECSSSDGLIHNNHFIHYEEGKTYWLAISHQGEVQDSSFTLTYSSYKDCDACSQSSAFECEINRFSSFVNGESSEGPFAPNTEVTVCVDIDWDGGTSWIHGIIPNFGKGWNVNSAGPNNVTIAGNWEWIDAEGTCATNLSIYELPNICSYEDEGILKLCNRACNAICPCEGSLIPDSPLPSGWFNSSPGGSTTCASGSCIPLENFGTPGGVTVILDFCFDLTVKSDFEMDCTGSEDLQISFVLTSDAITGCWEDNACVKPLTYLSPEWKVDCLAPPAPANINIAVCEQDLPFEYEGIVVDNESPAVTFVENYILPNTPATNGGDSIANVIIEILDADIIIGVECTMNEYILKANAITSIESLNEEIYTWIDGLSGDTLGVTDEVIVGADVTEVTLILNIIKNETSCEFTSSLVLEQGQVVSPPLAIIGEDSLCTNTPTSIYTAEESTDINVLDYHWEIVDGEGTLTDLTLDNQIFVEWISTSGTLCVSSVGDCANSEPICLDVNIFESPAPNFNWSLADGSTDVVQFDYTGSEPVQSYLWDFGDGSTSVELSPVHQYLDINQPYQVSLTVSLGACEETYTLEVDLLVDDITDINEIESLTISPNPSSGLFYVDMKLSKSISLEMQIIDIHGRLLQTHFIQSTNKGYTQTLDLLNTSSGAYLVRFISSNGVRTERIVID